MGVFMAFDAQTRGNQQDSRVAFRLLSHWQQGFQGGRWGSKHSPGSQAAAGVAFDRGAHQPRAVSTGNQRGQHADTECNAAGAPRHAGRGPGSTAPILLFGLFHLVVAFSRCRGTLAPQPGPGAENGIEANAKTWAFRFAGSGPWSASGLFAVAARPPPRR